MKGKRLLSALLVLSMVTAPTVVFAEGTNTSPSATSTNTVNNKDTNLGDKIRQSQKNAAQKVATQQERNQIKGVYSQMRTVEANNRQIYLQVVAKRKLVRSFIEQVEQGKIAYSDDQLNQITSLSDTLSADVQALVPISQSIKTDETNVKNSCQNKDYQAAITNINTELADRQARGSALTKVNGDLDALLAVLSQGQAVANSTPSAPASSPAPSTAPAPVAN